MLLCWFSDWVMLYHSLFLCSINSWFSSCSARCSPTLLALWEWRESCECTYSSVTHTSTQTLIWSTWFCIHTHTHTQTKKSKQKIAINSLMLQHKHSRGNGQLSWKQSADTIHCPRWDEWTWMLSQTSWALALTHAPTNTWTVAHDPLPSIKRCTVS